MLNLYLDPDSGSPISAQLAVLSHKTEEQRKIIDSILTDAFYTILLSLDGCANLGGTQSSIYD